MPALRIDRHADKPTASPTNDWLNDRKRDRCNNNGQTGYSLGEQKQGRWHIARRTDRQCMNKRMDKWMDRWLDTGMDALTCRWTMVCAWMCRRTGRRTWIDNTSGQAGGLTGCWTDRQVNRWMDGQTYLVKWIWLAALSHTKLSFTKNRPAPDLQLASV